ncbi:MAG: glycosyltransferase 61 family protein [Bacteroidales bacterium]|jgi:hypothetical protein|nr:glycosyltransferase 61 family protein [Bacteroidales bacterium]
MWKLIKKEFKAWKKGRKVEKDLIAQRNVAEKLDGYIDDFLNGNIEKVRIHAKKPELVGKKIIWQFWQQGIDESTPQLVRTCFESVQQYKGDYEHIILSKATLNDYIDEFPDYVWKKFGTGGFDFPKIANLVRLYLLSSYGGVWLDATILLTAPIPERMLNADFFALQRSDTPPADVQRFTKFDPTGLSWSERNLVRMQNAFMIAKPHHKIIDDLISIHLAYWKCEAHINHYFFFQILFFRMMLHKEWADLNCEIVDYADFHRLLMGEFEPFDKTMYDELTARWSIHKLSLYWARKEQQGKVPKGSFADVLVNKKIKMNPKIYASKNITKYIQHEVKNRFIKSGLKIRCVQNGVIAVGKTSSYFGVFDKKGIFVKESFSLREGKDQRIPHNDVLKNPVYFDFDVVYLGDLSTHFGHFLLEHWDRAYAFLDTKYQNMKFVMTNDRRIDPIPEFVTELARLLGIPSNNFFIISESTKFKNVYVPEQGFRIPQFSTKEFGDIYIKTANNVKKQYNFDNIYVSRVALENRKVYGEEKIQSIFEKNGYHIIFPEQLSIEEQIAYMKNCKSLAGCAGTALHLALFMPEGGNVIQIKRNSITEDNCGTQYLITKTKGLNLVFIDASIEKIKTHHFDNYAYPQIIGVTENMKRFFDDNQFAYSLKDIEFDTDTWNAYIAAITTCKSRFVIYVLHKIVKYSSCFIPNRLKRQNFRKRMKKSFGIEQF